MLISEPNTLQEDEMVNIIQYSGDEPDGVRVFSQIPGGEGNKFERAQEASTVGPENGHGNREGMDLDEQTKALAEEVAPFIDPKNLDSSSLQERVEAL